MFFSCYEDHEDLQVRSRRQGKNVYKRFVYRPVKITLKNKGKKMKLEDFVKKTCLNIFKGIEGANKELEQDKSNISVSKSNIVVDFCLTIDDVSHDSKEITVTKTSETKQANLTFSLELSNI